MKRIARITRTTKTYGTIERAERAALRVGDGKDLGFTIAADTLANGKVRYYPAVRLEKTMTGQRPVSCNAA